MIRNQTVKCLHLQKYIRKKLRCLDIWKITTFHSMSGNHDVFHLIVFLALLAKVIGVGWPCWRPVGVLAGGLPPLLSFFMPPWWWSWVLPVFIRCFETKHYKSTNQTLRPGWPEVYINFSLISLTFMIPTTFYIDR